MLRMFREAKEAAGRGESDQGSKETTPTGGETGNALVTDTEQRKICAFLETTMPLLKYGMATGPRGRKYKIRHIFVKKGKSANRLEKKLAFLILFDAEKGTLSNESLNGIWEQIQSNTCRWVEQIPSEEREMLKMTIENGVVFIDRDPTDIKGGKVKTTALIELIKQKDTLQSTVVLIADKNTLPGDEEGYFYMDENETICVTFQVEKTVPFHVSFDFNHPSSSNLRWGNRMVANSTVQHKTWVPSAIPLPKYIPRKFDHDPSKEFYIGGHAIGCSETGATTDLVGKPCHEFKLFEDAVTKSQLMNTDDYLIKFAREVLRFACGCMNARTNGTIHFGIADEHLEESKKHERNPCEIVGIPIPNSAIYQDKLTEYIGKYFEEARLCIHPPVFISVKTDDEVDGQQRYVIEVDVEPSSIVTEKRCFSVALPKVGIKLAPEEEAVFERRGGTTQTLSPAELQSFWQNMGHVDKLRKSCEEQMLKKDPKMTGQNVTRKLKKLLGMRHEKLDDTIHRMLVLCKNSDQNLTLEELREKYLFLKNIPWDAVIDFNNQGRTENGFCKVLTEDTKYDLHDAHDYEDKRLLQAAFANSPWIFANGRDDATDQPFGWEEWQMTNRKRGLDKLIQQANEIFPPGRVVIFFLILPGVSEIETLTFGQFCVYFSANQIMFYVEDEQTYHQFASIAIGKYMYVTQHTALQRGVIGLPWLELQEVVRQLTDGFQSGTIYIPISGDNLVKLPTNQFNHRLLTIMNVKECEELLQLSLKDQEGFDELGMEEENLFYQGQPVTWKNLWFTDHGRNHVLERDIVTDLKECIDNLLSEPGEDIYRAVQIVKLFYIRGSGGSTVARHVIWGLCRSSPYKCRCCIVRGIQDETSNDILTLYYFKNHKCIPVLALVDDTSEYLFRELVEKVTDSITNTGITDKVAVIFLYIKRSLNLEEDKRNGTANNFALDHRLSSSEYTRFKWKYDEMKRKYEDRFDENFDTYADTNLITFMILMKSEEARKEYVNDLVKQTLPSLSDREKNLAMYLSLLHIYDPYPLFLSCFDSLMVEKHVTKMKFTVNWTNTLSRNLEKFLRQYDLSEHCGTGKAVAITHPSIAGAILDHMCQENGESVGDIALHFLSSQLFMPMISLPAPMKYLHQTTNIILKQRKSGTRFSPLIEKILRHENRVTSKRESVVKNDLDKAAKVFEKGIDMFNDPALSQHLARLYYLHASKFPHETDKYFSKAERYARKALETASHNNKSFFMDTMGRLFKAKLRAEFEEDRSSANLIEPDRCLKAIKLGLDAQKWFQCSEDADKEYAGWNTAGYSGELDVMFYLLEVVSCCRIFRHFKDIEPLRNYLSNRSLIPSAIKIWPSEIHDMMKSLRDRYFACMAKVEENFSLFKGTESKCVDDDVGTTKKYVEVKVKFLEYFCPKGISYDLNETGVSPADSLARNRHYINKHLMGNHFYNVFNIGQSLKMLGEQTSEVEMLKKLKSLIEHNLKLTDAYMASDVLCKITISMALHSPFRHKLNRPDAISEYHQVKDYVTLLYEKERRGGQFKMYSYLFKMMFLWPHEQEEMTAGSLRQIESFQTALGNLKHELEILQDRRDDDFEAVLYPKIKRKRKTRSASTTLFYLGKGSGLDVYVHVNELTRRHQGTRDPIPWQHPKVRNRLKRCTGMRISGVKVDMDTPWGQVTVHVSKGQRNATFTKEGVTFYLGFSSNGPLAFDVQGDQEDCVQRGISMASIDSDLEDVDDDYQDYYQKCKKKLLRLHEQMNKETTEVCVLYLCVG